MSTNLSSNDSLGAGRGNREAELQFLTELYKSP